jgi:hypothetical protein
MFMAWSTQLPDCNVAGMTFDRRLHLGSLTARRNPRRLCLSVSLGMAQRTIEIHASLLDRNRVEIVSAIYNRGRRA